MITLPHVLSYISFAISIQKKIDVSQILASLTCNDKQFWLCTNSTQSTKKHVQQPKTGLFESKRWTLCASASCHFIAKLIVNLIVFFCHGAKAFNLRGQTKWNDNTDNQVTGVREVIAVPPATVALWSNITQLFPFILFKTLSRCLIKPFKLS